MIGVKPSGRLKLRSAAVLLAEGAGIINLVIVKTHHRIEQIQKIDLVNLVGTQRRLNSLIRLGNDAAFVELSKLL